jgi:hypothetical protein
MYVVSKDSDNDSDAILYQAEYFIEGKDFFSAIEPTIKAHITGQSLLLNNVNNPSILEQIYKEKQFATIDMLHIRRKMKETVVKVEETDTAEFQLSKDRKYDCIIEGNVLDKASKFVDVISDYLNDKGTYLYYFSIYEEQALKKKLVALLFHKYSVHLRIYKFENSQLPVIVLHCQRGMEAAGNKTMIVQIEKVEQTIEYTNVLPLLKEFYMSKLTNMGGVKEIVAGTVFLTEGRRMVYDACNPEVDPIIPFYNVIIVDTKEEAHSLIVTTVSLEIIRLLHRSSGQGEKLLLQHRKRELRAAETN